MIRKISTNGMNRAAWLEARRRSIGGSDAAAIVGLNPYSGPYTVWLDKIGKAEEKPETEAMRQGRDLEEYVAQRFTEQTGKRVRRENAILYNDAYPFAHANIDRRVEGENTILECKTSSKLKLHAFKDGNFPPAYYVQCMHYLAVTEAQKAYLAVLVLGEGLYVYDVERNEDEIKSLMAAEREFWDCVEKGIEPKVQGSADADALASAYPEAEEGKSISLFGMSPQLEKYVYLKGKEKEYHQEADSVAAIIQQAMADAETGTDGWYTVKWKNEKRKSFDQKAYEAMHGKDALAPWMKETTYRRFTVKDQRPKGL